MSAASLAGHNIHTSFIAHSIEWYAVYKGLLRIWGKWQKEHAELATAAAPLAAMNRSEGARPLNLIANHQRSTTALLVKGQE